MINSKNTFLVTGGCGFIGSHLVDELLKKNQFCNIIIVDNLSSGHSLNKDDRVTIISCNLFDLFMEPSHDLSWAKDVKYIFHLSSQIDLRKSMLHPANDIFQDVAGFVKMMEYFKSINRLNEITVIFSSTGGAMYSGDIPSGGYTEDCLATPLSPYGINKLTIEKYLKYYKEIYGLNYTILRYANVYGPRQALKGESGIIGIFKNNLENDKVTTINNKGSGIRDYTHVFDVVHANILAMKGFNNCYNISTGIGTSVIDLIKEISKYCNLKYTFNDTPIKELEKTYLSSLSYTLATKGNWRPTIQISEGIKLLFNG